MRVSMHNYHIFLNPIPQPHVALLRRSVSRCKIVYITNDTFGWILNEIFQIVAASEGPHVH